MSIERRAKGGKYVARISFNGKTYRVHPDTYNKSEAEFIVSDIKIALETGSFSRLSDKSIETLKRLFANQGWRLPNDLPRHHRYHPVRETTLMDGLELYCQDESFQALANKKDQAKKLCRIIDFLGADTPAKDIWIPDLKRFRQHELDRGLKQASINRTISALSRVYQIMCEHRLVTANPCRMLPRLPEKSSIREAYISMSDLNRIMALCPAWFNNILLALYFTGARRGEIVCLRWSQIDMASRIISFHPTDIKEGKATVKRVPIHRSLFELFTTIRRVRSLVHDHVFTCNGRPVNILSCDQPWQKAMKKLQWPSPRPRINDLRHTFKVNWQLSELNEQYRIHIMGHHDRLPSVDQRYGLIDPRRLVRYVDEFQHEHGLETSISASNRKRQRTQIDQKLTILKKQAL